MTMKGVYAPYFTITLEKIKHIIISISAYFDIFFYQNYNYDILLFWVLLSCALRAQVKKSKITSFHKKE